ncbi:MAG: GNAT family N-acetyltransferase [Synechococcus sp.]
MTIIPPREALEGTPLIPIAQAIAQLSPPLQKQNISFRAIKFAQDSDFLARVYASTRETELSLVDWSAEQKSEFLQMQFLAQHDYYQQHYKNAEFLAIYKGDRPIGRLYIERGGKELRIIDIALLRQARNRGIGSSILKAVLSHAQYLRLAVRIHIEQFNPAMRLYRRLGFRQIGIAGVYHLMEWLPFSESETA